VKALEETADGSDSFFWSGIGNPKTGVNVLVAKEKVPSAILLVIVFGWLAFSVLIYIF
jgi:hypothetical protein